MLNCWCFCQLKTAGYIIGWLEIIGSFLGFISLVSVKKEFPKELVPFLIVLLALILLIFLASALLVVGTQQERPLLLLPWLIINGISLVYTIVFGLSSDSIVGTILSLALEIYVYIGIFSLYKQLKQTAVRYVPNMSPNI